MARAVPSRTAATPQDAYASHLAKDDSGAIAAFLDDPTARVLSVSGCHAPGAACAPRAACASALHACRAGHAGASMRALAPSMGSWLGCACSAWQATCVLGLVAAALSRAVVSSRCDASSPAAGERGARRVGAAASAAGQHHRLPRGLPVPGDPAEGGRRAGAAERHPTQHPGCDDDAVAACQVGWGRIFSIYFG